MLAAMPSRTATPRKTARPAPKARPAAKRGSAAEQAEIRRMLEKLHRDLDVLEASVAQLGQPRR